MSVSRFSVDISGKVVGIFEDGAVYKKLIEEELWVMETLMLGLMELMC